MTMQWSFSYNSFVKFHVKKFGSHNMTVLYPNLCYNEPHEVCYKGMGEAQHTCKFSGFILNSGF